MYKIKGFKEKLVCVVVSTFLIFMFVGQLLLVGVFSRLYYLTFAKKTKLADFHYKSLKSWKINNSDLTQQFNLSIFTDFYQLTAPGVNTLGACFHVFFIVCLHSRSFQLRAD